MRKFATLAAAAALLGATSAHASGPSQGFAPTSYSEAVGAVFNLGAGTVEHGQDVATAGFAGTPQVQARGADLNVDSGATASWQFQVSGPIADALVPILITGHYDLSQMGGGVAVSSLDVGLFNSPATHLIAAQCGLGRTDCSSQNFTLHAFAVSDFLETISIHAGGNVLGSAGSFSAFIDPMITFDFGSGFDFNGLTLDVAPDAQPPAGGAPEPAGWALMILGFGGIGAAMRRRRGLVAV